jgi:uncharacterized protein
MCHNRAMRAHLSTLVLAIVALVLGVIAYLKDPGLPAIGARNGVSMLAFILPRMVPAILIAGLVQVLIPQETVSRYFGRPSGIAGIGPPGVNTLATEATTMVSAPFMVVLANSSVATAPLVAYMTAWSLFGLQRIIAWEAPLMGWRFVAVRVVPSLAFPVLAGWVVKVFYQE